MRVAIVTTSYPRHAGDPSGHFVESEARRLLARGARVTVFAPGSFAAHAEGLELCGIEDRGAFGWPGALARLRERPLRAFGASEFVLRALRELEQNAPFERVIAHFLVPSAWPVATRALRRTRSMLEVVCHGSDVRLVAGLPAPLRRRVLAELLACEPRVRFVSRALAALLPELAERALIEPSPIDLEAVPARAEARLSLGILPEARLAVIVARLVPSKNVASALSALALVPGVEAVVVGDGPLRSELTARFPEARFVGHLTRPESLRWIAASDVVVSASRDEGAPTVVREARGLGVPVVSLEAGDLPSWAESDPNLWLSAGR